ncbi:FMN-binding protein [Weissella muntiaci]|uniref:FMN-binding protein n=1 Tax=Weissella muntiaci TaxID=2508881 RepID=A0A6C2C4K6_9LACO|nr:FMN-binding protein [Weissella muntiaci]
MGIFCFFILARRIRRDQQLQVQLTTQLVPLVQSSSTSGETLKDGTYTGSDSSYEFGDIQVQIVVANGKISKVTAIKYPTDNQKTQSINENAIPTYEASAVKSQSASFSNISGATKTWEAFTESLKTAINDAG